MILVEYYIFESPISDNIKAKISAEFETSEQVKDGMDTVVRSVLDVIKSELPSTVVPS